MSKRPKVTKHDLRLQIAYLRRAALHPLNDAFRKEALTLSGGDQATSADWTFASQRTNISYAVWRLLNTGNEILSDSSDSS